MLARLSNTKVLTSSLLLHKDAFIDINGFDEDFSGTWSHELQPKLREMGTQDRKFPKDVFGYGYFDNAFVWSLKCAGYTYVKQRGYLATEWMEDAVGENVEYVATNRKLCRSIWSAKKAGKLPWSTDMLRFKWERVIHHIRGSK